MKHLKSQGFILLLLLFSFILLKEGMLIATDAYILHLKRNDFDAFFQKNADWREKFFERCRCSSLNYRFFCWNHETRKILFPDVSNFNCPTRVLPEVLNNKLIEYYKENSPRKTYLLTNDHMVRISLQHLAKNEYPCIYKMKSLCRDEDKFDIIEFYIFDFTQANIMEIYYCLRNDSGELELVANPRSLSQHKYVEKWDGIAKDIFNDKIPETRINIKLSILIGDRTLMDIYPDTRFIHFRERKKNPPERHNKLVTTHAGDSYLVNDLVFHLSDEKDLAMLKTNGIYVGSINDERRITYSSLYSLILENFAKTNLVIKNNTFQLFYARTTNFKKNTSDLNEKPNDRIKNIELLKILSFIEKIIRQKQGVTYIQLVGYADQEGMKKTNWKEWNRALSMKRTTNVKAWLKKKLEALGFKNKLDFDFDEPKGCSEKYYDYNDRCVDIKVF